MDETQNTQKNESIKDKLQQHVSLQFGLLGAFLFLAVQLGLTCGAPFYESLRWYNFLLLSLVGLASGFAGWFCGIVLSPIGSQASGAQKVLAGFGIFWTGVIVAHLDQVSTLFNGSILHATAKLKIQVVFAIGVFLLATCVTFNTRINIASEEAPTSPKPSDVPAVPVVPAVQTSGVPPVSPP